MLYMLCTQNTAFYAASTQRYIADRCTSDNIQNVNKTKQQFEHKISKTFSKYGRHF